MKSRFTRCKTKTWLIVLSLQATMLATLAAMFMMSPASGHVPPTNTTTPAWPDDETAGPLVADDAVRLQSMTGRLSLVCVAVFMSIYSFGWACVPSILNAELFPQPVRSVAASVCSFVGLTSGATCSYIYGPLVSTLGVGSCFAILAAVNLTGSIFAAATLPETKGRSLEDIDEMLGGHNGHHSVTPMHVNVASYQDLETGQSPSTACATANTWQLHAWQQPPLFVLDTALLKWISGYAVRAYPLQTVLYRTWITLKSQ